MTRESCSHCWRVTLKPSSNGFSIGMLEDKLFDILGDSGKYAELNSGDDDAKKLADMLEAVSFL